ncbi:hypothetical protein IGI37_003272 [Enterococcus sp. AZ194]|uniref:pectate lyase-like adhesive domain-containing protein n=1 Tax=Enterococcus sp. AZ194 TaxID=2774629 RepID=UPI003F210158
MKKNGKIYYLSLVAFVACTLIGLFFVKGIQPIQAKEEPYQLSLIETEDGYALKLTVEENDEKYILKLKGMEVDEEFAAKEEADEADVVESEKNFSSFEVNREKGLETITFTFSNTQKEHLIPVVSEDFSKATAALISGEKEVVSWKEPKETESSSSRIERSSTVSESTSETTETTKTEESESQYLPSKPSISEHIQSIGDKTEHATPAAIYAEATQSKFIPATAAEIAARNATFNSQHGNFNPNANVKNVSTWAQFYSAYNDQTTTKIVLQGNITDPSTGTATRLTERTKSIEIDGQGYTLYLERGHNLKTHLKPSSFTENGKGRAVFHMHDIVAAQGMHEYGDSSTVSGWRKLSIPEQAGSWSFISGDGIATNTGENWYYRFGNIKTIHDPQTARGVARLARAYSGEVTMYGHNEMPTIAENFYAGSVIAEPGTFWLNTCTHYDYSTLWFEHPADADDTGGTREYTVGQNSFIYSRNTSTGPTYPAIYQHYGTMTIGENATFNANMQGNAVRFDDNKSGFVLKAGATANLLSRGGGSVVAYEASNATFEAMPTSRLYVVGQTEAKAAIISGQGIIDMDGYANVQKNNKFILNSPEAFDIRNRNGHLDVKSRVLDLGSDASNSFEIISSDIDIWKNSSAVLGPSDYTYEKVASAKYVGATPSSSDAGLRGVLASLTNKGFRRISGMNMAPMTEWLPVTDADKTYGVRVIIGYTPKDSFDQYGNAVMMPVYASKDQAEVTFVDTFGKTHVVKTDADGYAKVTDTKFNKAGGKITALAKRGPWIQEVIDETTVVDVTPPEPLRVTGNAIAAGTPTLTATGVEAQTKVKISINGGTLINAGTVAANGTWSYKVAQSLKNGDTVTIYLEDTSTLPSGFDTTGLERTRISSGNRNPSQAVNYHDATFKKATTYTVNKTEMSPEVEWLPVTDADKSYAVKVIVDYTDKPVYATKDQAEVTFVDTFGKTHVAKTDANGVAKVTDTVFNKAGSKISALAKRGTLIQNQKTETTVIDVTPPEPIKLLNPQITNADKMIYALGAEPNAKVKISINGGWLMDAGTVTSSGYWVYNLPFYLEFGDMLTIYLEDTSTLPGGFNTTGLEATRTATGNRNPEMDTVYHDATFKAASSYFVMDVLPDSATITKSVALETGGKTTQVGDTLLYTIKVKNTKDAFFKTTWKDVKIEDILDEHLDFDPTSVETAGITPAGTAFVYDEATRKLTISIGNLATQAEKTVTFKATVKQSANGQIIPNKAKAIGFTPQEAGTFVPGNVTNPTYNTFEVETAKAVENPGGPVIGGSLTLVSAPEKIDFDIHKINEKSTYVTAPVYSNPLTVEDTRSASQKAPWHITVKLTQELTVVNENGVLGSSILKNAIRFKNGDDLIILNEQATPILGNEYTQPDASGIFNLSNGWSDTKTTDGFELYVPAGKVESTGNYQAVMEWNIENTPLPAAANSLPKE